ncbi:GMC oxidoreductase [Metabacillus arenae]|uniref:GMC family oxidoreductase N-terminal domain-containing protein n=1 Tax=Metabacillus arenae TaxID=2771434 RepID=A0A926NG44_9BACI|nr:GMC oxidoreductase [Metabacillus arenae]MBD1379388.1 GMC family oxidoreductase N-terminal domain-containing protein [Metabacillus arenae]
MKIITAFNGDTLETIAKKYRIQIDQLIYQNPHIPGTDLNIGGHKVNIPSPTVPIRVFPNIPSCTPLLPTKLQDEFIPLASLDKMAQIEYDVLVVGTGAGGGAAIWRLCEQLRNTDKKIGVVEAGPILLQTHAGNLPTLASSFNNYFLNPKILRPIGYLLPELPGAREIIALGGMTLFWGLASPRMYDSEWNNYPINRKELEFYYNIAEQMMLVSKTTYPLTYTFLERLWEGGFPETTVTPKALNLEPAKYGPVVNFSSISFLASALMERPFDLAINSRAVQILTVQEKVTGIKVMTPEKKVYELKAKNIILSANAFQSPRLLLSSGIKGRAIGHYLTIHSFLRSSFQVNRPLIDTQNTLQVIHLLIPQTESHPYQIQFDILKGYEILNQTAEHNVETYAFGKVEPRYENMLFLDPNRRDKYGVPEIQVNFAFSAKDKLIISQLNESIIKAAAALGSSMQPEICLSSPGIDFHVMGTCRMGDDPSTSTTNRFGQVHSMSGLYVADNSILPNTGAANPTLTTVALAIRTADYIARQLS